MDQKGHSMVVKTIFYQKKIITLTHAVLQTRSETAVAFMPAIKNKQKLDD